MDSITTLTVGRVSGLIAFGNFVLTVTFPLLLAIVLIHRLRDKLSAVSWSVLARQLHSTLWPSILRTDSVAGKHVYWSVSALAYTNIGLAVLGVVSGVVTPLGLGDHIRPAESRDVSFHYAPDLSNFGKNTIARPVMPLSRDCIITSAYCPGAIVPGAVINQGEGNRSANPDITATTRIPENITEMFSSVSKKSSVAGILDIQYRFWLPYTSEYFDDHKPYPRGQLLSLESLISRDDITLVEGVIADMHSGGIGFRNHSVPSGIPFGAEWEEDILWVEPEISCVNTNLTYELTLADTRNGTFSPPIRSIELVDEGGFSNLRHGNPYKGWPNITYASPDPQLRADRSAWLNNFLAGFTYNLTDGNSSAVGYGFNVTPGKHYPIAGSVPYFVTLDIQSLSLNGAWLNLPSASFDNNGTLTVGNRTIKSAEDDLYCQDDHPLWALEDWWHPGSEGAFTGPLWGIVDNSYKGTPGYNFTRAPSFYLPYSYYSLTLSSSTGPLDNLAGASMPYGIMGKLLLNSFFSRFSDDYISYSGASNVGLGNKWRNLSKTADDASKLLRLIWTDIMASNTVGTNMRESTSLEKRATGVGPFTRTVRAYERKVTYDLRFAIPAIFFLFSWLLLLLASLVMTISDGHPFTRLKKLLNDTSVGRIAASSEYPESRSMQDASTKDWLASAGHLPVRLSGLSKVPGTDELEESGKAPSSRLLQPALSDNPDNGTP
ncbi:hypothetical protein H112_03526 [Trichophyton rubrum D6]|uniref:Uncharacterized protein n=1 Tax=Trichophyton rubrum TaxID=5551 RepID=A0A178EX43_TRIRU|nr:hypothetical protein H102_03525 [Trichophyton rubrum CBS 100081]EZF64145.1 hypothetical protein H104_03521 [Trichophyton rubrum CBS 289.86]EZF85422.1 hypothetical protein H110_03532 [Trichophyton rubrum MR1448]EZG17820.1 hypothetical protein H107_03641 [Trichophyton rubrum CBS 202.88]KDB34656.1 hypothetical protein H112_03526 [Trichophyton rubrum D6]OAL64498.1 hypothetical protein A7C99_3932 [Trichophyton rubrum]